MRWFYATTMRVPGRKAHSSLVAQECRSFLRAGLDLVLLRAARSNYGAYRTATIEDWYGFSTRIPKEEIPCIDMLSRLPRKTPASVCSAMFLLLTRTYTRSLNKFLGEYNGDYLLYTTDIPVAEAVLSRDPKRRVVLELHMLSESDPGADSREMDTLAKCQALVVVTRHMKTMLVERGYPEARILVAPNAVDPEAFPGTAEKHEARKRLNLSGQGPMVTFMGNFHAMGVSRGLETVIRSIPEVAREIPNIKFMFVGGPMNEADRYIEEAKLLGIDDRYYEFRDRQPYDEMHWWLGASDVLVHPLPYDAIYDKVTSPLKIFEYMTSGRPIIASNLPSIREVLENEVDALLVTPGDHEELGKAVVRLLKDREMADQISQAAREKVKSMTWDARAKRISDWLGTL